MIPKRLKKRGFELSVSFLVMLILTLAVFGMGIYLVNKFFGSTKEMQANLDQQTSAQLEALMDDGSKVAVPINKKEVKLGEQTVFGVGVLNTLGTEKEFNISVTYSTGLNKNNEKIDLDEAEWSKWMLYEEEPFTLKNNEKKKLPILIRIPGKAAAGRYVFDIEVLYDTTLNNNIDTDTMEKYDDTRKIQIVASP